MQLCLHCCLVSCQFARWLHQICELGVLAGLFRRFRHQGMSEDDTFLNSVETITGTCQSCSPVQASYIVLNRDPSQLNAKHA